MSEEELEEMKKRLESLEALGWPEIDCDHGAMPDSHDADFMSLAVKAYKLGFEAGHEEGIEFGQELLERD
jgi:hypothetical protein